MAVIVAAIVILEELKRVSEITWASRNVFTTLRNRKHFPGFYRITGTRGDVWEKREIAWKHEHEVRMFPRNFKLLPNCDKCFYTSIRTRKIEITSWLVSAYDFYSRAVKNRKKKRVSAANE